MECVVVAEVDDDGRCADDTGVGSGERTSFQ